MSAIVLDNLTIVRGQRAVLKNINLTIPDGTFIGVLGSNGAGKTTLFQSVLGLITPTTGQISIFGKAASRGDPTIGYVPQMRSTRQDLRLEVGDFLGSSWLGERWGLPSTSRAKKRAVERALEQVGAEALQRRMFSQLSGGERQRVLLAQCLMTSPRILLLDEPLMSLDPARTHDIIELIHRIQRQLNITVLFSAHQINPLLGIIDQVLYMGQGNALLGKVNDVITSPVLSGLYGADIEVIRVNGRIFVMESGIPLEESAHEGGDSHLGSTFGGSHE